MEKKHPYSEVYLHAGAPTWEGEGNDCYYGWNEQGSVNWQPGEGARGDYVVLNVLWWTFTKRSCCCPSPSVSPTVENKANGRCKLKWVRLLANCRVCRVFFWVDAVKQQLAWSAKQFQSSWEAFSGWLKPKMSVRCCHWFLCVRFKCLHVVNL